MTAPTTERDTALRSAVSAEDGHSDSQRGAARGRAREDSVADPAPSAVAESHRRAKLLAQLRPPEPWQHRPASLAAMWRYARRGGWTGADVRLVRDNPDGPWRQVRASESEADLAGKDIRTRLPASRVAGIWWFRLVALPICTITHYLAWLVARPSRTATVALLALVA